MKEEIIKQEDIELLLKDLCVRMPDGVICNTPKGDGHLCSINQTIFGTEYGINIKATERDYFNDKEVCIKPYLRPMSSMTKKEKEELNCLCYHNIDVQDGMLCGYICAGEMNDVINWLNKNMFDYRGLIPKGLAIAITKENNPYKNL